MEFQINHDLHIHTNLSSCCYDMGMTKETILDFASKSNYEAICFTDHLWDRDVKGPSIWYETQDISHISQLLPLPVSDKIRVMFGCEIEYSLQGLSLDPEHFDLFDFVVIPVNHFHMTGFTRPEDYDTPEKIAELFTRRLEDLVCMDLPWEKVGIAHLTCSLTFPDSGDGLYRVFRLMPEKRLSNIFRFLAKRGTGIELNAGCFNPGWTAHEDDILRIYRIAKNEGCRFYCASDAHSIGGFGGVFQNLGEPVKLLAPDDSYRYIVPM